MKDAKGLHAVPCFVVCALLMASSVGGFQRQKTIAPRLTTAFSPSFSTKLSMNILSNIGDMLSGGKLTPQRSSLPHGDPLERDGGGN